MHLIFIVYRLMTPWCDCPTHIETSRQKWRKEKRLADVLDVAEMKPGRSFETRWASHKLTTLTAFIRSYPVIVAHMKEMAAGKRRDISSDQAAKVKSYLKQTKSHLFLYWAH